MRFEHIDYTLGLAVTALKQLTSSEVQHANLALTLITGVALPVTRADYYVGPTALGNGSGSDWSNRAAYTNTAF